MLRHLSPWSCIHREDSKLIPEIHFSFFLFIGAFNQMHMMWTRKTNRIRNFQFNARTQINQSGSTLHHFPICFFTSFFLLISIHFYIISAYTEKASSRKRNGIVCMESVRETKSTILFWAIVDFLANTKEKALPMLVFIRIESEYTHTKNWKLHYQIKRKLHKKWQKVVWIAAQFSICSDSWLRDLTFRKWI